MQNKETNATRAEAKGRVFMHQAIPLEDSSSSDGVGVGVGAVAGASVSVDETVSEGASVAS